MSRGGDGKSGNVRAAEDYFVKFLWVHAGGEPMTIPYLSEAILNFADVRMAAFYIDPNAAGMLSQVITPLLIMAAAALTFLRRQIGAAFSAIAGVFRRHPATDAAEPPVTSTE